MLIARMKRLGQYLREAKRLGLKHLGLSDVEARMMGVGRSRNVALAYSFEVAADSGLLVAAGVTTSAADYERLVPLVQAAKTCTPVDQVLADSGYYSHGAVASLEKGGIFTVIPTSFTARDLRTGQELGTTRAGAIRGSREHLVYDEGADVFRCSPGNVLRCVGVDKKGWRQYRAHRPCTGCALSASCLSDPKRVYRTLKVTDDEDLVRVLQARFSEVAHRRLYHKRAPEVETVFGFTRRVLGFERWSVRGEAKVDCEASLLTVAYQLRKIHTFLTCHKEAGIT